TMGLATYFIGPFTSAILAALLAGAIAALIFFELDVARFGIGIGVAIVLLTTVAERLELIPYGPLFVSIFGGEFRPSHAFVLVNALDRKSTRLNSSHVKISYAVFCLK